LLIIVGIILSVFFKYWFIGESDEVRNFESELDECLAEGDTPSQIFCRAIASRDESGCLDEANELSELCLFWVYSAKALEENDVGVCDNINFKTKDFCNALFTKDETICNTGNEKEPCLNMVRGAKAGLNEQEIEEVCSANSVQKLTENYCKAMLSGEEEQCERVNEIDCYSTYYTNLAVFNKDISYCGNITESLEATENCRQSL
jgi:hypothetical protein